MDQYVSSTPSYFLSPSAAAGAAVVSPVSALAVVAAGVSAGVSAGFALLLPQPAKRPAVMAAASRTLIGFFFIDKSSFLLGTAHLKYLKFISKLYTDLAFFSYQYIVLFFMFFAIFCSIFIIKNFIFRLLSTVCTTIFRADSCFLIFIIL